MTTNIQSSPYLPRQKNFPIDNTQALGIEIDKAYIDIANRMNERTIGTYPANAFSSTGEQWFLTSTPKQTQRQVYPITSYTNFDHGINTANIQFFTVIRGMGYNGIANYFPIPFVNGSDTNGNVEIYVTTTQVIFVAGADAPTISTGFVLLEWLVN